MESMGMGMGIGMGMGMEWGWRAHALDATALASLAKDVNASYELASKVGAALGGYFGVRMTSQQREQLYVLHGTLHAALERTHARMRLPNRFTHEIRQLCLLRGLHEFLPLYPLPHAIGSAPLVVLEDTLKAAFDELGWEFTPAHTELGEDEAAAARLEGRGHEVYTLVQKGQPKRYFCCAPLPEVRWAAGTALKGQLVQSAACSSPHASSCFSSLELEAKA